MTTIIRYEIKVCKCLKMTIFRENKATQIFLIYSILLLGVYVAVVGENKFNFHGGVEFVYDGLCLPVIPHYVFFKSA